MGRKTHGPYLVAAVEMNDIQKVSDILSTKFRDKTKVKTFLTSEVRRLASEYTEVPLLLAATHEDPTILKYMVQKHNANINYIHEYGFQKPKKRKTALLVAVRRGLYVTVDSIIGLNADVNIQDHKGRTPLHHAIRRADYRMVKLLVSRGAQVMINDISGNSPLHVATIYGHSELIRLLLKYGGDLYKRGQLGAIPIHIAAREGHSNIVKMLCEIYEVNSDIKVPCYDDLEKSPLHVAASQGHAETVFTLLTSCGAEVNLGDSEGNRALHHTVLNDYDPLGMKSKDDFADTVKVLLNAGAMVNLQNGRGETAMHLAARSEFQKVIEILVLAGCDPLIEDNDKNRALDLVADDDAVSKQTIKSAIANRDRIMYESAEVRAQGFQTNFQRGTMATASSRSHSLLNMNGIYNLSSNKLMNPNFGSQTYMPPNFVNVHHGSHSSSNSSNKRSKESVLSGSRLLPPGSTRDQIVYNDARRTKSVEDLDLNKDKKNRKQRNYEAKQRYIRKNSYQESEATSMWSVTPPGSVQDLVSDRSRSNHYKKSLQNKRIVKNPETIIENQEYEYSSLEKNPNVFQKKARNYDTASLDSDDYFLDDESVEMLETNRKLTSNKLKNKEHVAKWVEVHKPGRHNSEEYRESESESDSDVTSSFESEGNSDDDDDGHHTNSKQNFSRSNLSRKKNSNIEQVIELDATGDDDQTTIRVIPISGKNKTRGYSESEIISSPEKQSKIKKVKDLQSKSNKLIAEHEKPVPKKRTNVQNSFPKNVSSVNKNNNILNASTDIPDNVKTNKTSDLVFGKKKKVPTATLR